MKEGVRMKLEIRELTPELLEDYFTFFEQTAYTQHDEWGKGCYCCFFHAESRAEWEQRTGEDNRAVAAQMIGAGKMSGLLAYIGGKPVGWCHFDDRQKLPGLKTFYPEVLDDEKGTGSIVCFTVAQGYRRMGVAGALLEKACEILKARGFCTVEAYPRGECADDQENYHGPSALYIKHGFSLSREAGELSVWRRELK